MRALEIVGAGARHGSGVLASGVPGAGAARRGLRPRDKSRDDERLRDFERLLVSLKCLRLLLCERPRRGDRERRQCLCRPSEDDGLDDAEDGERLRGLLLGLSLCKDINSSLRAFSSCVSAL